MTDACAQTRLGPAAVSSNGAPIRFDASRFMPMRDSGGLLREPERLRRRFAEDGYVLLRGLLDRRDVLDLRAQYFSRFDTGLLAEGTDPEHGVFSGVVPSGMPAYGTEGHPAYDFVRSREFDAFTRQRALASLAELLLGGPAELVPRRIVRHFHRLSGRASRAHVDFDYMDRGTDQIVTTWIPLGDCPVQCGGLVHLEGSHLLDRASLEPLRAHTDRPDDRRPLSNDLDLTARALGGRWLWNDYRAGDVVAHSPHMVHASLDNTSDLMRLSVDIRFRRCDTAADDRWSGPWSADDGF